MQFQVVVDHEKHFWDVFVGLPSSMNDSKIYKYLLFTKMQHTMDFSTSNMDLNMVFIYTFLGTKATHSYLGPWFLISIMQMFSIPF